MINMLMPMMDEDQMKLWGEDVSMPELVLENSPSILYHEYQDPITVDQHIHGLLDSRIEFGYDLRTTKSNGFKVVLDRNAVMAATKGLRALKSLSEIRDGVDVVDVVVSNAATHRDYSLNLHYESESANQRISIPFAAHPNHSEFPKPQYFVIKRLLFIFDVVLRMKPEGVLNLWVDGTHENSPISMEFKSTYGDEVSIIARPFGKNHQL